MSTALPLPPTHARRQTQPLTRMRLPPTRLQVRNAASLCYTALLVRVLGFRNAAGKVRRRAGPLWEQAQDAVRNRTE